MAVEMTHVFLFLRVQAAPVCECLFLHVKKDNLSLLSDDHDVIYRHYVGKENQFFSDCDEQDRYHAEGYFAEEDNVIFRECDVHRHDRYHAEGYFAEEDNVIFSDRDVPRRYHTEGYFVEEDNVLFSDRDVPRRFHTEGSYVEEDDELSSYRDVPDKYHAVGSNVEEDNVLFSYSDIPHRHHAENNDEDGQILYKYVHAYPCSTRTLTKSTEQADNTYCVLKSDSAPDAADCSFVSMRQCAFPEVAGTLCASCECLPSFSDILRVEVSVCHICAQGSSQVLSTSRSHKPNENKRETQRGDHKYVTQRLLVEEDTSSTAGEDNRAEVGNSGPAHDSARAHCGRLPPDSLSRTGSAQRVEATVVHTSRTNTQHLFTNWSLTRKESLRWPANRTCPSDGDSLVGCVTCPANSNAIGYNVSWRGDFCALTSVKNDALLSINSGRAAAFVVSQELATQNPKACLAKLRRSELAHSRVSVIHSRAWTHCGRLRLDALCVLSIRNKPAPSFLYTIKVCCMYCIVSFLYALVVDVVILIMLWRCPSRERTENTNEDYLRFLMGSFFNDPKIRRENETAGYHDKICKRVRDKSHSKPVLFDVLNNVVLQPWTPRVPWHDFARALTRKTCGWSDDTRCGECRRHLDRHHSSRTGGESDHVTGCLSRRAGQWEVEVRPLLRFLPDATNNPDLDMAHVGYRLATLSALPPTFTVSRVRLADAGFYYRGQGDEVTCYACRGRHSGWASDDKPWDVHRRISPDCPHVLAAPGGAAASLSPPAAPPGISPPPVTAPRQEQATPQAAASKSSQLVTSQGSSGSGQAPPPLTLPRVLNAAAINPHRTIDEHGEDQLEDGDPTSLNTTTLTPSQPARTEARPSAGRGQVGPSPPSEAEGTMPPVYPRSRVLTTSAQSSATNNPPRVLESGAGRSESSNTPAGSISRSNAHTDVTSRNTPATTAAEDANRSRAATPGNNVPGVGSGGGPGGGTGSSHRGNNVSTVGGASAALGGGANASSLVVGGGASARYMFPRAGLELGGAVYPMYQDMASRRRSFPRWDETHAPPLDQVILCGMFYAGYADCVRCFYCGVGLKHWEVTDDVWTEHVRWRPSCGYLRAVKGDDFIRRIQTRLAREAPGDDDNNEDGPGEGNDRPPQPPGPPGPAPIPHRPPGAPRQDRGSRGHSGSGSSGSSSSQHGNTRSSPPGSPPSDASAALPRSSTTLSISSQTMTLTTAATATAPSTSSVPASSLPASASPAASSSPPSGNGNIQPSTRPEGGTGISVVEGETHSQRVSRLQAENAELSRRLRCNVCHLEPIDTILMPCGHLVVCENCARNITQCPLCHGRIRATAKVHMN